MVYVQEDRHASIGKAWRMLGFDPANLRVLRADPATGWGRGAIEPRSASTARPACSRSAWRDRRHDQHGRRSTRCASSPTCAEPGSGCTSTGPTARRRC